MLIAITSFNINDKITALLKEKRLRLSDVFLAKKNMKRLNKTKQTMLTVIKDKGTDREAVIIIANNRIHRTIEMRTNWIRNCRMDTV